MTPLEDAFATWAEDNAFVNGAHDAAFEGELDGVRVSIDTGVRHAKAFTIIARIEIGTGEASKNLRPDDPAAAEESAVIRALREAIRVDDVVRVVWADADRLTVRSRCENPELLATALRRLIEAVRQRDAVGPYR